MRWAGTAVGLGAILGWCGGTGCGTSSVFICAHDGQCEGGRCEPNGYCSFPSGACASGWAYAELAAPVLAGTCVGDEATTEAPASDGSGGSDRGDRGEPPPITSTATSSTATSDTTESTAGMADASVDSDAYETYGYRGACEAYATLIGSCTTDEYGEYAYYDCLERYTDAVAEGSPCFEAFVEQLVCISSLDCQQLMMAGFCELEIDLVDELCPPSIG